MIDCSICKQPAPEENIDSTGTVLCTGCARDYILGRINLKGEAS